MLLSQGQPSTQSSNYTESSSHGNADAAVDGNMDQTWAGRSCMHTMQLAMAPEAWWMVDLGSQYRIGNISVWNRKEGMNNICNSYLFNV